MEHLAAVRAFEAVATGTVPPKGVTLCTHIHACMRTCMNFLYVNKYVCTTIAKIQANK